MIAISLWQPWATALLLEFPDGTPLKPDETRHWALPARCVGVRVAVHAAKRDDAITRAAWRAVIDMHHEVFQSHGIGIYDQLPHGALVGEVVFSRGVAAEDAKRRLVRCQHLMGEYGAGRFAWPTVSRLRYARPIPAVGRQGFFNVPEPSP